MSYTKDGRGLSKTATKYRVPAAVTTAGIYDYLSALDCPRALTVWLMFVNNEHLQLSELKFSPEDYLTISQLRSAYCASKFLSKYKDFSLDVDLKAVALEKFSLFEKQCGVTNKRFRDLSKDTLFQGPVVWLHNAIIRKISDILGHFDCESFVDLAGWGPGASTLIPSRSANAAYKFQFETGITRELYSVLCPEGSLKILAGLYPRWASQLTAAGFPLFQTGNKVVTVDKDATTDRVIAIEPGINLWFQKAIGQMMRRKLLKCGIDLRFQSRNQRLAREASFDGSLATVDFSSASDSISNEVVQTLLPSNWYRWLDLTRSHFGTMEGKRFKWNKFSSMGNGFTFELETLIFYATAFCCAEYLGLEDEIPRVSAYGDDVIIPTASFPLFAQMCEFYGFTVNERKTHIRTFFRESCGSHFVQGIDVKPIFLKQKMSTIQSVYRFANNVRRLAHRWGNSAFCDSAFETTFGHLIVSVPPTLRLRIPDGLGDGGFISNFDEATPRRAKHGVEGHFVTHVVDEGLTFEVDHDGLLLARLWYPSIELCYGNSVTIRGRTRVKITSKTLVSQWYNLGEWI